jgi:hypothetical protein
MAVSQNAGDGITCILSIHKMQAVGIACILCNDKMQAMASPAFCETRPFFDELKKGRGCEKKRKETSGCEGEEAKYRVRPKGAFPDTAPWSVILYGARGLLAVYLPGERMMPVGGMCRESVWSRERDELFEGPGAGGGGMV